MLEKHRTDSYYKDNGINWIVGKIITWKNIMKDENL